MCLPVAVRLRPAPKQRKLQEEQVWARVVMALPISLIGSTFVEEVGNLAAVTMFAVRNLRRLLPGPAQPL